MNKMKPKKILTILGGLFVSAVFLLVGVKELQNSRRLIDHGKTTTGKILDLDEQRTAKGGHLYYIEVEYRTETGVPLTRKVKVKRSVFNSVNVSDPIKVHYLPECPSICALGETVPLEYSNIIWGAGFLGGAIFLMLFIKQPADHEEAVDVVAREVNFLKTTHHEWSHANPKQFPHLDSAFYDTTKRHLEHVGYRFISDLEDLTVRKHSGVKVFVRQLISPDESIAAGIYHFKPIWQHRVLGAKQAKVTEFESWFSDGTFVVTGNAEMAGRLDSPPEIDSLQFASGTPWNIVLDAHRLRVQKHLASRPAVQAIRYKTEDDLIRAGSEQRRIKGDFRQHAGLSKAELERITGKKNQEIDNLHAALTERV
jgi:hypothetical protein